MSPIEQFQLTSTADLATFGRLFSGFKNTAFRLELLSEYNVESERPYFEAFLLNPDQAPPSDFNTDWHDILKAAALRGAVIYRCRAMGEITPYMEFEKAWGYKISNSLGEQIRTLAITELREIAKDNAVAIIKDFWLFDNADCYFIEYDFFGTFLGVRKAEGILLKYLIDFAQEIWLRSDVMSDL